MKIKTREIFKMRVMQRSFTLNFGKQFQHQSKNVTLKASLDIRRILFGFGKKLEDACLHLETCVIP